MKILIAPEKVRLFTIGGRNAQGKTSILSAIEYVLGGEKHRPSSFVRDGAEAPAHIVAKLSNGIVVEKHDTGVIADQKEKAAKEMPYHPDVGEVEVSLAELTAKLQAVVAENGRRQGLADRIAKGKARLASEKSAIETELSVYNTDPISRTKDASSELSFLSSAL